MARRPRSCSPVTIAVILVRPAERQLEHDGGDSPARPDDHGADDHDELVLTTTQGRRRPRRPRPRLPATRVLRDRKRRHARLDRRASTTPRWTSCDAQSRASTRRALHDRPEDPRQVALIRARASSDRAVVVAALALRRCCARGRAARLRARAYIVENPSTGESPRAARRVDARADREHHEADDRARRARAREAGTTSCAVARDAAAGRRVDDEPARRRATSPSAISSRRALIQSANDAAVALADYVGHGTTPAFIAMMNAKAQELGLDRDALRPARTGSTRRALLERAPTSRGLREVAMRDPRDPVDVVRQQDATRSPGGRICTRGTICWASSRASTA